MLAFRPGSMSRKSCSNVPEVGASSMISYLRKADKLGMFLWAELVIRNLELCSSDEEILAGVRELPGSLPALLVTSRTTLPSSRTNFSKL